MKGFAAIGLHRPKDPANVGGVMRAAHAFGAKMVIISGDRVDASSIRHATNTSCADRHIPVLRGDLRDHIPFGAVPVAVELLDDATPLPGFSHPRSAYYIFGPEDGSLGKGVLDWCLLKLVIPTTFCLNLAAAVNVVLYDRVAKLDHQGKIAA